MDETLASLIRRLDLERLEVNLFRGLSADIGGRAVFGGQVIGQALAAAERTVEGRAPHSLHAYFLLAGDVRAPIVYSVDRLRDGRSFSARRVLAVQHGQPILSAIASFQAPEAGLEHSAPMPDVPAPDSLPSRVELRERALASAQGVPERVLEALRKPSAFDFRPIDPVDPLRPTRAAPAQAVWFRTTDRLPDDPALHRRLLAYVSDSQLLGTPLRPHARSWFDPSMYVASLDHAVWFHRSARIDEWLLYAMDSLTAQGARGLARGTIFDRAGRLVASVAQEGLMRDATLRSGRT